MKKVPRQYLNNGLSLIDVSFRLKIHKRTVVNVIFFLCFFPFLKIIPGIEAEVQPFCGIVSLIFLCLFGTKKDSISYLIVFFIIFIGIYSVCGVYRGVPLFAVISLYVAYLMPIFTFLVLRDNLDSVSVKLFHAVFVIHLLVGILEQFGYFEPVYLRLFENRADWSELSSSGRGIPFLAPEPAYGATILMLMLATSLQLYIMNKISRLTMVIIFFSLMVMFFFNKSATGMAQLALFFASFCFFIFLKQKINFKIFFLLGVLVLVPLGLINLDYILENYSEKIRFLGVLKTLKEIDIVSVFSKTRYQSFVLLGGKRLLSVSMGYYSLIDYFGLGHGVSSYIIDFGRISHMAGINWTQYEALDTLSRFADYLKPDSYGAALAMDTGIIGLVLLISLFVFVWKARVIGFSPKSDFAEPRYGVVCCLSNVSINNIKTIRFSMFTVACFMILFNTTTSLPVAWILLAYVFYLKRYQVSAQA